MWSAEAGQAGGQTAAKAPPSPKCYMRSQKIFNRTVSIPDFGLRICFGVPSFGFKP